jgi:hypothetical protein
MRMAEGDLYTSTVKQAPLVARRHADAQVFLAHDRFQAVDCYLMPHSML